MRFENLDVYVYIFYGLFCRRALQGLTTPTPAAPATITHIARAGTAALPLQENHGTARKGDTTGTRQRRCPPLPRMVRVGGRSSIPRATATATVIATTQVQALDLLLKWVGSAGRRRAIPRCNSSVAGRDWVPIPARRREVLPSKGCRGRRVRPLEAPPSCRGGLRWCLVRELEEE